MASQAATGDTARRRQDLRDFLRSRRARVTPAEAGLPDGGRRRTPGLRREEVAVLAGVGASWYQWLEQGRDITVSPQVLDSVARDPYWNTVAHNDAAHLVLGHGRPGVSPNCLIAFFTDPVYRARAASWEANAPMVVAQYRAAWSARPGDEGFDEVIGEASALSAEFAELWGRGDVQDGGRLHKEMDHPLVGALLFETTQLRIPVRPDLNIVLHNPRQETDTAAKLEWLTSPEGRRGAMSSVAG